VRVAIAVLLSACSSAIEPTPIPCVGTCISDLDSHCVRLDACADSADCPTGLTCVVSESSQVSACHVPGDSFRECRRAVPRLDRTTLAFGFETQSMAIEVQLSPLAVDWTLPAEAKFVACGVFVCNPVFRRRPALSPADRDPLGNSLVYIANAEACMLEFFRYDASRDSARLGRARPAFSERCEPEVSLAPAPEFLAVGCWAYDDYHVVAASDLEEIMPEEYAAATDAFALNTSCTNDGASCFDPMKRFFGRCAAGLCQPLCVTAEDCDLAAQTLFDQQPTETCTWECVPSTTSVAGGCVPRTQPSENTPAETADDRRRR
jgi:hypothetical protein